MLDSNIIGMLLKDTEGPEQGYKQLRWGCPLTPDGEAVQWFSKTVQNIGGTDLLLNTHCQSKQQRIVTTGPSLPDQRLICSSMEASHPAGESWLEDAGWLTAEKVVGQYLILRKKEDLFKDWLKQACRANEQQQNDCYDCIKEWCDFNL
ncbi:hypothetical protein JZ751_000158 [Albula glossodonta]|uniref:Uncharacterized protein n=1 Tax=Albula glossodonta TaxID=121402 RepID=A0A8T2PVC2_9TELE|nr:hypothetical protein JZ751_000158 [Albula glossodonta]